ncbi:late secretory pathway protein AVL9 homolog isoform X5 [Scyliorhinus canicula]|uniref:late secretory pathway protein AVL9 homolog isoform X5 n=1 Tax=Scyliorhinus canicula TaxID=7830 RepID=UPI0018F757FF|nr:late secretory pathway protein AVL9 homolog isoform X5 [Scyliorhinus canicula]
MESGAEAAGGGMEPGAEAAACGMEPGADGVVLHIVVVGFHHKKGCQVEFSYPPLVPEEGHDGHSLPEEWKYLPFLALPDGAHNYLEDTVYFHLPPRSGNQKTVYGVSCYRQIEAKALKVRQADVTRETVQKSVCVLSRLPLYGLLQAKLQLITHAYFEEKDFSQISILKTIILFKLILLEKKVLFYLSPVNRLVGTLMTVLSLFPGMVEHGLADSSQYKPRKSTSEDVAFQEHGLNTEEYVSISVSDISNPASEFNVKAKYPGGDHQMKVMAKVVTFPDVQRSEQADSRLQPLRPSHCTSSNSSESDWETLDPSILDADNGIKEDVLNEKDNSDQKEVFTSDTLISQSLPITVQPQANTGQTVIVPGLISGLKEDQYGMPLAIFTKGYLCLPYMALQQHHLLSDVTVRGFVAGATNILFRQQKHLSDAVIDIEDAVIQIHDPELRKLLNLTTADLRFADFLVKHVTENRDDIFLDGTGWEGGDEWIRAQFALYIHSLLATTLQPDNDKMLADYGILFITAWKNTHNFRVWNSNKHPAVTELNPGHPFQGQYNVLDVKLRLSHSVQNSERGKKFGNAMISTSRSMVQTGKAVGQSVGGALTSAKSAMTSWFSTFNQQPTTTHSERQSGKH